MLAEEKYLADIKDFPKSLLKKKKIPFYKAVIINDLDQEIKLNTVIDVLAISKEAAIASLANELPLDEAMELKGKVVSFAIITLLKEELTSKPIVDNGQTYFEKEMLALSISGKQYEIDVDDNLIEEITIDVDPKTEYRIVSGIKLGKA